MSFGYSRCPLGLYLFDGSNTSDVSPRGNESSFLFHVCTFPPQGILCLTFHSFHRFLRHFYPVGSAVFLFFSPIGNQDKGCASTEMETRCVLTGWLFTKTGRASGFKRGGKNLRFIFWSSGGWQK